MGGSLIDCFQLAMIKGRNGSIVNFFLKAVFGTFLGVSLYKKLVANKTNTD